MAVLTFSFSEPVTGFTTSDFMLSAGTAGTLTALSTTQYTLAVKPPNAAIGTLTASVAVGLAQDAAGDTNDASPAFSLNYDTVPPTVASAATGTRNNTVNAGDGLSVTLTMSKSTGFTTATLADGSHHDVQPTLRVTSVPPRRSSLSTSIPAYRRLPWLIWWRAMI